MSARSYLTVCFTGSDLRSNSPIGRATAAVISWTPGRSVVIGCRFGLLALIVPVAAGLPPDAYRSGAKYPCRLWTTISDDFVLISTDRHFPSRAELVEV